MVNTLEKVVIIHYNGKKKSKYSDISRNIDIVLVLKKMEYGKKE